MNDVVLDSEQTQIKALQPLHILSNHEYNLIKKNNIKLQDMKTVSTQSAHSGNITIFRITEENVGVNIRKQFNIQSQKNVLNSIVPGHVNVAILASFMDHFQSIFHK